MKKVFKFCLCCALSIMMLSSCQNNTNPVQQNEKPVIESHTMHISLTLESIPEYAETIVHGTVSEKGDAYIYELKADDGDGTDMVFTPVYINVIDCYKGTPENGQVVYEQRGGETDEAIYMYNDGPDLEPGDEVIIFLNEANVSWGDQGVFVVKDGKVSIPSHMLPASYAANEDETYTECPVDDFEQMILETLN